MVSYKAVKLRLLLSMMALSFCTIAFGQSTDDNTILSIERNKTDNTPTSITFTSSAKWRDDAAQDIFRKYLGVDGVNTTMVLRYASTNKNNATARRYDLYYKGIKVEYGSYSVSSKGGFVTFVTGNYYNIDPSTPAAPGITEGAAFAHALKFVGAEKYMWEDPLEEKRIQQQYGKPDTSFKPHGILEWVEDFGKKDRKLHLAYAFDVYAQQPLSRQMVFVDAITGQILHSNSLIKHTAASGHSRYSGVIPFVTSHVGATYQLYDSTRGSGVHTLNMHNGSSYGAATEYNSPANTWPLAPPDTIALDAHWAAEMVYDYWKTVQGRLSYDDADGQLNQYVHYSTNYDNAFWDGTEMTYGDGSGCGGGGFTPLVSLDVTGHEIGHGVCQYTANLVYASESGALNEGFSDCWGATIEAWADPHEVDAVPKQTWSMGEEIGCGNPLRRLDFPKLKSLPDTYNGTYWYDVTSCFPGPGNDECGVHTNSGVLCKWYYLVTVGGSGTNDLSDAYSVTGIGFTESANILYQTELVLSSTADYALTRTTSINTATTLYGACSPEVVTVTNAWYAVGVGPAYVAYPANITGTLSMCVGGSVTLSDATPSGTWSSSFPLIATVGATTGTVFGASPGVDTITYSIGAGCDAKALVTVNAFPAATITPAPIAVLCAGSNVTLTADAGVGYTYQWQLAGSPIGGATNITYNTNITGNYTVKVTSSAGCSTTSGITTVTPVALPSAIITAASSTTFCPGGSVVLNASTGAGYTYQWALGGIPISGAVGASYTASTGGNYTVFVTNSSGCSATSATTVVTVNPPPSAITGTTTVCSGATTLLSSAPGGGTWSSSDLTVATVGTGGVVTGAGTGGTAIITYTLGTGCYATTAVTVNSNIIAAIAGPSAVCVGQTISLSDATMGGTWSSTNPAAASVDPLTGVVSGVGPGTTTVSYAAPTPCGTGTATTIITSNAVPVVAAITSATSTICTGGTVTFSDATPTGVWSSSNTALATVGSASGVATGIGLGTPDISYTVTNAFGCATSVSTPLTMFSPFTSTATPAGPTSFCTGGSVVLNATAGTGYTYQWYKNGAPLSGATSIAYTASATGNYAILITETGGCNSLSAAVFVNVNPSPIVVPAVTINASPGFIMCLAISPATFTAVPTNGGASPTYQWYVNGTGVGSGNSYSYTPAVNDAIKCVMTSSNACAVPATAISSSDTVKVSANLMPSVSIIAHTSPVCAGDTVKFSAVPVNGGTAPTYLWTKDGINVATGPDYIYAPLNGDHMFVTMVSNYPCLVTNTATSPTISIPVHNHVTNTLTVIVSQSSIVSGSADTFTAIAPNGGTSPAFQWLLNGMSIAGANSQQYITNSLAAGQVISCIETSSVPCAEPKTVASSGVTVHVIPVGVQQVNNNGGNFTLLPNPNKGEFTIEGKLNNIADEKATIIVTDMLGQTIYTRPVVASQGNISETITLDNSVANGMYLVTIASGSGRDVYHVVVNR